MKKGIIFLFVVILLGFTLQANAELIIRGMGTSADGTYQLIYDTDLNITWYDYTKDGAFWQTQMDWASSLTVNLGGTIYDDWRLPSTVDGPYVYGYDGTTTAGYNITSSEMGHLFYTELGNKGFFSTTGVYQSDHGLINKGSFTNLMSTFYSSGTPYAAIPGDYWSFYTTNGFQRISSSGYAIAVRNGDVAGVTPFHAEDYFPLDPGAIWQYLVNGQGVVSRKVLNEEVTVEGVKTRPVEFVEEHVKEYYTSDSNGIFLHRQYQPQVYISGFGLVDIDATFIPPIKLAGGNVWIGQSFHSSGRVKGVVWPPGYTYSFYYTADSTIEGQETITVPAGTFDTIRYHTTFNVQGTTQSSTRYLAEGIGVVKDVTVDPQGKTSSFEMLSLSSLWLLAPNGGEIIPSGGTYDITWKSSPDMTIFRLSYSLNNGVTWIPISGAENVTEKHYLWTVPIAKKNKNSCRIKVIGYNDADVMVKEDISDSPFTIEVVKVTSPDGLEWWTSGELHSITWITNGTIKPVAKVKLSYSKNNGIKWLPITTIKGSNPGTYDWIVPSLTKAKNNCKVKVVLRDSAGHSIGKDISDQVFMMQP